MHYQHHHRHILIKLSMAILCFCSEPLTVVNAAKTKKTVIKKKIKLPKSNKLVKVKTVRTTAPKVVDTFDGTPTSVNQSGEAPWETDDKGHPIVDPLVDTNVIYYRANLNSALSAGLTQAVAAWNALNVITLKPAPDNWQGFVINIAPNGLQSLPNCFAVTNYTYVSDDSCATMSAVTIELSSRMQNGFNAKNVFEHELGHAMGFAHDQSVDVDPINPLKTATHIMYAGDGGIYKIPLSTKEQNALRKNYQLF